MTGEKFCHIPQHRRRMRGRGVHSIPGMKGAPRDDQGCFGVVCVFLVQFSRMLWCWVCAEAGSVPSPTSRDDSESIMWGRGSGGAPASLVPALGIAIWMGL